MWAADSTHIFLCPVLSTRYAGMIKLEFWWLSYVTSILWIRKSAQRAEATCLKPLTKEGEFTVQPHIVLNPIILPPHGVASLHRPFWSGPECVACIFPGLCFMPSSLADRCCPVHPGIYGVPGCSCGMQMEDTPSLTSRQAPSRWVPDGGIIWAGGWSQRRGVGRRWGPGLVDQMFNEEHGPGQRDGAI